MLMNRLSLCFSLLCYCWFGFYFYKQRIPYTFWYISVIVSSQAISGSKNAVYRVYILFGFCDIYWPNHFSDGLLGLHCRVRSDFFSLS